MNDPNGKFVKVKWVRTNKGSAECLKVRCSLVAQELGFGVKDDELFAGTLPLIAVKLILVKLANDHEDGIGLMIIDFKCAFLYGNMKRTVYIELPNHDEMSGDPGVVGFLMRSIYGTRGAPFIWQEKVRKVMKKFKFQSKVTHVATSC